MLFDQRQSDPLYSLPLPPPLNSHTPPHHTMGETDKANQLFYYLIWGVCILYPSSQSDDLFMLAGPCFCVARPDLTISRHHVVCRPKRNRWVANPNVDTWQGNIFTATVTNIVCLMSPRMGAYLNLHRSDQRQACVIDDILTWDSWQAVLCNNATRDIILLKTSSVSKDIVLFVVAQWCVVTCKAKVFDHNSWLYILLVWRLSIISDISRSLHILPTT